jgi:transketolase
MPSTSTLHATPVQILQDKATLLRIGSVLATTEAGSGHPTSCASAADIVSVLFFSVMRFDPKNPRNPANDIFVLSKGHAAPLLYAAWSEAGEFPREHLLTLRKFGSDLEGHPTPRLPFVQVPTGSLGQGLCAGAGMAWDARKQRVYVLMGDGESAEGSVWEAAQWASAHGLSNLCATIDINRLGQSGPTALEWDLDTYQRRWEAFGWQAIEVDGHDISALLEAYGLARATTDRPTVVLARTVKGKGLGKAEGADNWHGKAMDRDTANQVVSELRKRLRGVYSEWEPNLPVGQPEPNAPSKSIDSVSPPYETTGKEIATRKAFGDALAALGKADPRVVVVDGDVKNSTHTEEFEKVAKDRFLEGYIAEQNMVGMAMGLAARGRVPFASTFACFFTRAYDFIRMAAIGNLNIKLVGTHAGVSIGEDGPSQMGLEDLAMMCAQPDFTVLYPADATSAWRATWLMAQHNGPCYMRAGRPNQPVLYEADEEFAIGKCKVLRRTPKDRALIVAAGVTVHEALLAQTILSDEDVAVRVIDLFSIQPIDAEELRASAQAVGGIVITVEDHYEHGGIGDAVLSALAGYEVRLRKLAVREIARSGKPAELLERYGINASYIVDAVRELLAA